MFRLGIIGSDNSHADVFAALANLPEGHQGLRVEGVAITHIYGTDPDRTKQVANAGRIPNIVEKAEDMLGQVDGVLCVWRHGAKHIEALPFLEAGIPAFIDKPLATSVADAERLVAAAEKTKVGFSSFSALRYDAGLTAYVKSLDETAGRLTTGVSTGPADVNSEYGGIFFYGIHAVEVMNTVWGYGCESVQAVAHNGNVMAACKFANGSLVTLNLLGNATYVFHVLAFGKKGWKAHTIEGATYYFESLKVILDMMRTGHWPLTRDQLLEPVRILTAIDRSLKEEREVRVKELAAVDEA